MTDTNKEREDLAAFYAWLRTYENEVGALDDDSARVGFLAGRASLSAEAEPVAEVVPCHTPSGKRVALRSEAQTLPIGTKLYTSALAAPAQAPAPGWVSVPVEPTSDQMNAAIEPFLQWKANAGNTGGPIQTLGMAIYRAMIAAAPSSGKGG